MASSRTKARQRAAARAATDPKGAPTKSQRTGQDGPSARSVNLQWFIVGAVVISVVVLAIIFAEPGNSLHGG
ncbi:MAG: hypothetical protein AAFY28_04130 [Actinomycetota bacterium]